MASVDDLDDQSQLIYMIGLITREDISLDRRARDLFGVLVGKDSPAIYIADRETGRLLSACDRMLERISDRLRPDLVDLGRKAISSAVDAHQARNAYAHSLLIPGGTGWWSIHGSAAEPPWKWKDPDTKTLQDVRDEHLALVRSMWQVWALASLLRRELRDDDVANHEPDWERILRGEFTADSNGSIYYGESP